MTDSITKTEVVRIQIGDKLLQELFKDGITLSYPNQQQPTHQFQITLDPAIKKILTNGVCNTPVKKKPTVKKRVKQSR